MNLFDRITNDEHNFMVKIGEGVHIEEVLVGGTRPSWGPRCPAFDDEAQVCKDFVREQVGEKILQT